MVRAHTLWSADTPVVVSDDVVPEEELERVYRLKRLRVTMDAWISNGRVEVVEEELSPSSFHSPVNTYFKVGTQKWLYAKAEDLTEEVVAAIGLAVQFAEKSPVGGDDPRANGL